MEFYKIRIMETVFVNANFKPGLVLEMGNT